MAITVIKPGNVGPPFSGTCKNCGCEVTCGWEDAEKHSRRDRFGCDEDWYDVACPTDVCGERIELDRRDR